MSDGALCSGRPCYPPGFAVELLLVAGGIGLVLGLLCVGVCVFLARRGGSELREKRGE